MKRQRIQENMKPRYQIRRNRIIRVDSVMYIREIMTLLFL